MEKPSVTLRHDAAYLLSALLFLISVGDVVLAYVSPADPQTRQMSFVAAMLLMPFCIACAFKGGSTETLDESGIFVKKPFYSRKYPWSDILEVSVETIHIRGGTTPVFSLKVKNRKRPLELAYNKRSKVCITCYYGQPDEDKWGKPPTLM